MNWYGIQKKSDMSIVSYTSDDVKGYSVLDQLLQLSAPFQTLSAAQAALQPVMPTAQQSMVSTLQTKPSANWTIQDVADWLKTRS